MTDIRKMVLAGVSAVSLTFAASAFAQEPPPEPYAPDGPYSQLSPGQQKIVDAMYDNQTPVETTDESGATTTTTMDKDQLTAYKDGTGWGVAFKNLQGDGQFADFKNLGQLISSTRPNRPERPEKPEKPPHPHGKW